MAKTLSEAIDDFLRANAPPHISVQAWRPLGENSDDWEFRLDGGAQDEREELTKLVNVFVMGWRMCRISQEEDDRDTIKLRNFIARV